MYPQKKKDRMCKKWKNLTAAIKEVQFFHLITTNEMCTNSRKKMKLLVLSIHKVVLAS